MAITALGNPKAGYRIDAAPIVWKDYVIAGSAGGSLPPGTGFVKGNITALNGTSGEIIWNLDTTTGEWVKPGKTPPNGGAELGLAVHWIQRQVLYTYH